MSETPAGIDHRLGPVDRIPPGEGREFAVGGRRIAVFRPRGGAPAATGALCPHRGGPLADGLVGMDSVVCPLHNRRFAFADGATQDGDCAVEVHPVRVEGDGEMVVTLPAVEG